MWVPYPTMTNWPLQDICFTDQKTAYVVGAHGTILQTPNAWFDGVDMIPDPLSDFKIQPNPANNFANIELSDPDLDTCRILIFNFQGKQILEIERRNNQDCQIDVRSFPSGIYLIQMIGKSGIHTEKLAVFH